MAFVVDDADLRRLDAILAEFVPQHSYELKTSNGAEEKCATLDGVLRQPNSSARRFVQLVADSPWDSERRVTVSLRDGSYDNVKYDISGDDDKQAFDLANQLDEWIAEIRPWYSRVATADFIFIMAALWGLAWAALLAFVAIGSIIVLFTTPEAQLSQPSPSTTRSNLIANAVLGFFLLSLLAAWMAGLVRRPLFPVATFRVGGGIRRDNRARSWRVFLSAAVIVPVILALTLNWLGIH